MARGRTANRRIRTKRHLRFGHTHWEVTVIFIPFGQLLLHAVGESNLPSAIDLGGHSDDFLFQGGVVWVNKSMFFGGFFNQGHHRTCNTFSPFTALSPMTRYNEGAAQ